jgi:hypothetical protein
MVHGLGVLRMRDRIDITGMGPAADRAWLYRNSAAYRRACEARERERQILAIPGPPRWRPGAVDFLPQAAEKVETDA